jgi:serine/threonine protein kinase
MALTPGTRLGPYEILAPLGAGGMGEVYRARDTTLGRDVALKTPASFASEPERLARFEREAKIDGEVVGTARLSPDGTWLYFLHGSASGDIWTVRFDDASATPTRR